MKALFSCVCCLVLLSTSSIFAQEWIENRWASLPRPDLIDSLLRESCKSAVGTDAPSFTFQDLADDSLHSLAEYKGKVTLVNFWGTHCSGCRMEMPDLSRIQRVYRDKGVVVVFLSAEDKHTLEEFFAANKIEGTEGIVDRKQLSEPYQMLAMPSTFLIDKKGIVRDMWLGPETFVQLEKKVTAYLALNQ